MPAQLQQALDWLSRHPQLHTVLALCLLLLVAWTANWLVKRILVRGLNRAMGATQLGRTSNIHDSGLIKRLSHVVPALILISGVHLLPNLPPSVVVVVVNVASAFIVLTLALALSALLDIINTLYQLRRDAHMRPIKGYLQVVKIAVFAIATILSMAASFLLSCLQLSEVRTEGEDPRWRGGRISPRVHRRNRHSRVAVGHSGEVRR